MFGKIFVPVDGSLMAEYCLPHLISMAKAYEGEVFLLHMSDPVTETSSDPWDWQIRQAEAQSYIQELSTRLQKAGLQAQVKVLTGKFPDNLINRANSQASDLIMMSSHGLPGENGWDINSAVMNLVQRARTSVMIVRSYQAPPENELVNLRYRRILVPLDGSQRAEYGLSAAVRLAQAHQAEILLVHVIKPPEMPRKTPLNLQDSQLVNQVVESNRAEASQYLDHLKASLEGSVESRLLVSDQVADSLHWLVKQEKIDLVILNAHGLSGNPQWPYGNIASHFLANAATPLLVIQDLPQDRNSPPGLQRLSTIPEGAQPTVQPPSHGLVLEVER